MIFVESRVRSGKKKYASSHDQKALEENRGPSGLE